MFYENAVRTRATFQLGGDCLPFTDSCRAWDLSIATYFVSSQNLQPSTVALIAKPGLAHNSCYHIPNLFLFFVPLYLQPHIPTFQELSPVSWGDPNTKVQTDISTLVAQQMCLGQDIPSYRRHNLFGSLEDKGSLKAQGAKSAGNMSGCTGHFMPFQVQSSTLCSCLANGNKQHKRKRSNEWKSALIGY